MKAERPAVMTERSRGGEIRVPLLFDERNKPFPIRGNDPQSIGARSDRAHVQLHGRSDGEVHSASRQDLATSEINKVDRAHLRSLYVTPDHQAVVGRVGVELEGTLPVLVFDGVVRLRTILCVLIGIGVP